VVWAAVVGLTIITFIISVPTYFKFLQTVCAPETCFVRQLQPQEASALQQFGLSLDFYAWYLVVWASILFLAYLVVAAITWWRKSDDWMVLLTSLAFVTFGSIITPTVAALLVTASVWSWLAGIVLSIALVTIIVLFYLFPDGRFVPRWTRWLALA